MHGDASGCSTSRPKDRTQLLDAHPDPAFRRNGATHGLHSGTPQTFAGGRLRHAVMRLEDLKADATQSDGTYRDCAASQWVLSDASTIEVGAPWCGAESQPWP